MICGIVPGRGAPAGGMLGVGNGTGVGPGGNSAGPSIIDGWALVISGTPAPQPVEHPGVGQQGTGQPTSQQSLPTG